jgi:hypothetical protein
MNFSASYPFEAVLTSNPSSERRPLKVRRIEGSSSTNKIDGSI